MSHYRTGMSLFTSAYSSLPSILELIKDLNRSLIYRYHSAMDGTEWPAEMHAYNEKFTKMIEAVKRRHDPVVTTVGRSGIVHTHRRKIRRGQRSSGATLPRSVFDSLGRS